MSATQYSSINSNLPASEEASAKVEAGGDPGLALTKTPGDDSQPSPPLDPFAPQQFWLYLQFFIPLLVVFIFPPIFAVVVYTHDHLSAPKWLSDFTIANPRTTLQIVTIFASVLTATTRWALGGAAALLALKRLLEPRPIFEIDMFFSLKNISVIWDWKHRRRMMLLTWLLVIVCGLLTSGFVTLFNPLSMQNIIRPPPIQELDFSTKSDACAEWYDNEVYRWLKYGYMGNVISGINSVDVTSFTRIMAMHYLASKDPSKEFPTGGLVQSYQDLNYTRILGSSAGTLATGPLGVKIFGFPTFSSRNPNHLSYSLDLQGSWMDASCSYDNSTVLNVTWGNITNGEIEYRAACPGSSTFKEGTTQYGEMLKTVSLGTIGLACTLEGGARAILFRDFYELTSSGYSMDHMKCDISPHIGDAKAVLDPDLQAFNMTKSPSSITTFPPVATRLLEMILGYLVTHFASKSGMRDELDEAIKFHTGVSQVKPIPLHLELVALMLRSLYELEATMMRRAVTGAASSRTDLIPPECMRQVKVELYENVIGWEVKWSTLLGLMPLLVVCVIAFAMITLAFIAKGKLTLFDPMSPVSLIAATSMGEVTFPKQITAATIGDPLDENVLITKVSYGQDGQTWGLRSLSE